MSRYYWTTKKSRGEELQITDGGHYEALERQEGTGRLATSTGTISPKSDIPELCVSKTPEASLFAKIQGVMESGKYHIYSTDKEPDTIIKGGSLDFEVLEECRFDMSGENTVQLTHLKTVAVPSEAVKDVENVYAWSEPGSVNSILADKVKSGLSQLIGNGTYPSGLSEAEKKRRFEEYVEHYGEEFAKDAFDDIPE